MHAPTSSPSSPATPAIFQALLAPSLWKAVGVGAFGAFLGFLFGEPFYSMTGTHDLSNIVRSFLFAAAPVVFIALFVGAGLLILDNVSSLRGQWHRDLGPGAALFTFLGFASMLSASLLFAAGMLMSGGRDAQPPLPTMMLIRGLAWTVFGAGIGSSIGILRGDRGQTVRGAIGGAIGGFLGGALFDPIYVLLHDNGTGVTSRALGFVILGAITGGALRLVQETLKSSWLLGISTGPYEGKEYPLSKSRLTVGRGSNCDLSLFRDESLAPQVGAFVFQNGGWFWQGDSITINGVPQTSAQLFPGARLQIGQTLFRFNDRSKTAPRDQLAPVQFPISTQAPVASSQSAPVVPVLVMAPPLAWTFSPSIGNTLTGFRLSVESGSATVGRATENDWQLKDDGTSSRHARIERTFEGLALTDLGSTNGTFINGQKMAPNIAIALGGGETIRFGRTQWMVRRGG